MVEKNITTWEDFKSALTENITEDTTYNIKNDLDATQDILTKPIITANSSYKKIFNGNGFKINGITTYSTITIFKFNDNVEFNNLQFTNIMAQDAKLFFSETKSRKKFNGCFINGLMKVLADAGLTTYAITFNNCSFNVKISTFSNYNNFYSCYIFVDLFTDTNILGSTNTFSNCYIDGTLKNTLINNTSIEHVGYSSDSYGSYPNSYSEANVFNCKVIVTNYNASYNYYGASRDNGGAVLNNSDKVYQSDGVTKIPTSQLKTRFDSQWLTDEQLKNKDYIQQNTDFPIYG